MSIAPGAEFERIVANLFRKGGWRVRRHLKAGDFRADLVVDAGGKKYLVEVKAASEGRRDRLVPLLSQAILQAQAYARQFPEPAAPLAVVAAKHMPESVAEHLKRFAQQHAPDVAVGVIDAEGFRSFVGAGLETLEARPSDRLTRQIVSQERLPDLFSDLNQWMLKILIGQRLPEAFISIPRKRIRNATQLAEAAGVSVMSASRLVNQLEDRGFLGERRDQLYIVRVEELLDWWASSNRETATEVPAQWIIKSGKDQALAALRQYTSREMHNQPRCCLGLFAAADALGVGFVRGVPAHIYLERITLDALDRLGLATGTSNRSTDVIVRIPVNRKAVFRPIRAGAPISDVLQVWLDVAMHPARGREQAREIQRRILKPLFAKQ
jgi:Holliday junction resolvase